MTRVTFLFSWFLLMAPACSDDRASDTGREDVGNDTGAPLPDIHDERDVPDVAEVVEADGADGSAEAETEADASGEVDDAAADEIANDSNDIASTLTIVGEPVELVGAGFAFGECVNACAGTLRLEGATVAYELVDVDGTPNHRAHGILTTEAAGALGNAIDDLVGIGLEARYGCPDCDDGGAAWLEFEWGAVDAKTTFRVTYEAASPPAVLGAVHAVARAAIDGLQSCTGSTTVLVSTPCPEPER